MKTIQINIPDGVLTELENQAVREQRSIERIVEATLLGKFGGDKRSGRNASTANAATADAENEVRARANHVDRSSMVGKTGTQKTNEVQPNRQPNTLRGNRNTRRAAKAAPAPVAAPLPAKANVKSPVTVHKSKASKR